MLSQNYFFKIKRSKCIAVLPAGEAKSQLRIAFSVKAQLNCDSKRKHDMLLRLWGFLKMRNAEQETLHMCTNSCTRVFRFIRSCKAPSAKNFAVPFLYASKEKVPHGLQKLVILLAEYQSIGVYKGNIQQGVFIFPLYVKEYIKGNIKYLYKKVA